MSTYFGTALKAILKDRQITQQELADAVHVTVNEINRLANGHHSPNFRLVERIAEVLRVPVSYFSIQNKEDYPDEYDEELKRFIMNPDNKQWLLLAKRLRDENMTVNQVKAAVFWRTGKDLHKNTHSKNAKS